MGRKDEMTEMARLGNASELEPDEGEAGDDADGDDGVNAGEDAAEPRTGRKRDHFLSRASRCEQLSNSTARKLLSCLHQMGNCLG